MGLVAFLDPGKRNEEKEKSPALTLGRLYKFHLLTRGQRALVTRDPAAQVILYTLQINRQPHNLDSLRCSVTRKLGRTRTFEGVRAVLDEIVGAGFVDVETGTGLVGAERFYRLKIIFYRGSNRGEELYGLIDVNIINNRYPRYAGED